MSRSRIPAETVQYYLTRHMFRCCTPVRLCFTGSVCIHTHTRIQEKTLQKGETFKASDLRPINKFYESSS